MNKKKITITSLTILACSVSFTACSENKSAAKPKTISYTQAYKGTNKKQINKELAKKLKKDQEKAKAGNEDYNYSLYLYKVQLWQDQTIAVNVDKTNYAQLSDKEKLAVGQSVNKLIKKVFKENHVKSNKQFFITIYDEDGNTLIPAYSYQTFKFKYKEDQKAAEAPVEYQNALEKAQSYSDNMHMSKQGIYEQLTSKSGEGFKKKAADYAIKHVKADWNKNALKKAKSYQKDQHMSINSIKEQLTSAYGEQFTESQADYAIKHLPK